MKNWFLRGIIELFVIGFYAPIARINGVLGILFVMAVIGWFQRGLFLRLWAWIRRRPYVSKKERERLQTVKDNPLGGSYFLSVQQSPLAAKLSKIGEADGIIYGKDASTLIYRKAQAEGHTLVIGGTGEGKTVSHVIPTLLSWRGSAIVIDIKGELYAKTADYRQSLGRVIRFNPVGNDSAYNPIDHCTSVFHAQDLARTLIPEPSTGDPFWAQSAQGIFAAAILEGHSLKSSLSDVAARCIETPIQTLIEELGQSEVREIRLLSVGFADLPSKTLGSVAGEIRSKLLTLATDKGVVHSTRKSDFEASDLDKPTTLYLTIPESRLEQLRPLWTAVIQQLVRHMQERPEGAEIPIIVMLDEFPRLGKLPEFDGSLATLRSKNVHFSMVIQSLAQLDDRYGEDIRRVIVDNCAYKLVLSATDDKTQKVLSDLAGQRAVKVKSTSISHGGDWASALAGVSGVSVHEQTVPLIRPEEFGRLGEAAILFQPRTMPMKIQRLRWYENKVLQAKVNRQQGA